MTPKDIPTPVHPGPGYSMSPKPSETAQSTTAARTSAGIPTKEEFVKAGYKPEGYDAFVAERTKQLGGK